MKIVVFGATGIVGKAVVSEALSMAAFIVHQLTDNSFLKQCPTISN